MSDPCDLYYYQSVVFILFSHVLVRVDACEMSFRMSFQVSLTSVLEHGTCAAVMIMDLKPNVHDPWSVAPQDVLFAGYAAPFPSSSCDPGRNSATSNPFGCGGQQESRFGYSYGEFSKTNILPICRSANHQRLKEKF